MLTRRALAIALCGGIALLTLAAPAGAFVAPAATALPKPAILRVEDKDARDRRLCRGKYKNVGKCKDGVPTGQNQPDKENEDEDSAGTIETAAPGRQSRDCEIEDSECQDLQENPGAAGQPAPATQGSPVLE